jgi:hypothetical protein
MELNTKEIDELKKTLVASGADEKELDKLLQLSGKMGFDRGVEETCREIFSNSTYAGYGKGGEMIMVPVANVAPWIVMEESIESFNKRWDVFQQKLNDMIDKSPLNPSKKNPKRTSRKTSEKTSRKETER